MIIHYCPSCGKALRKDGSDYLCETRNGCRRRFSVYRASAFAPEMMFEDEDSERSSSWYCDSCDSSHDTMCPALVAKGLSGYPQK